MPRVVELAGGVGGAKLADGLQAVVGADLTVVVNTGDDLERHGLQIWPDHDTVAYTLAGLDDEERGWGLADESWTVIDTLAARGEDAWFRLGDRDLATHLVRTERLGRGERPTDVARALGASLGVPATILPMTDDEVRTEIRTPRRLARVPGVLRPSPAGSRGPRGPLPRDRGCLHHARGDGGDRGGRRHRHRPVEPDRVDRPDPRRCPACARHSPPRPAPGRPSSR